MRRGVFTGLMLVAFVLFVALGVWQVQRLAWKTDLIARVNARVHAPATVAPSSAAVVTAKDDEYRHVFVRGQFLHNEESQVYTLSDYGAGYWVMTPLRRADGTIVYVNRGFVPMDKRSPATRTEAQRTGDVTVTGLLRIPETKGWLFSQANDSAHDAWYHRDIAAMARSHHLTGIAPYFIDADASPNPGGWPKGGLTVIRFPNSHLVYAITWFSLAGMLAWAMIRLVWFRKLEDDAEAKD